MIDSRSCRSPPSCFERGIDGGKKIRGVKINVAVDKYGIPLAIDVSPTNRHDTKGIVLFLRLLADGGFQGPTLGDLSSRNERLAKIGETLGITVEAMPAVATGSSSPLASAGWSNGPSRVEPLPADEHHLGALEGAPRRVRCGCLHLHPRTAPDAPRF